MVEALWQVENLGLAHLQNNLVDWNIDGELLLYHSKVYIPNDDARCAEIVRILHDLLLQDTWANGRQLSSSHTTIGGRG